MERLAAQKETFDIVIADPPPFVKSRKDLEPGAKAYRKLARLAADGHRAGRIAAAGLLLAQYSAGAFRRECAAGIVAQRPHAPALIRRPAPGPDHPVHPMLPETAYLKALVYALD